MKSTFFAFLGIFLLLSSQVAKADYTIDFLRISCVPEAGFFDIDYRGLENDTAQATSSKVWAKHGYYSPSNLNYQCSIPGATYKVRATQQPWSSGRCGASPDIYLTVSRNNKVIIKHVVFGENGECDLEPEVTRVSITEANSSNGGREAEICYTPGGKYNASSHCSWFFSDLNGWAEAFPFGQYNLENKIQQWLNNGD